MIVKVFGVDFKSKGGALTLPAEAVTKSHKSGWSIEGLIIKGYYRWVNSFSARHEDHGRVYGDFEMVVLADSEAGFAHFWQHHEPEAWDYCDI